MSLSVVLPCYNPNLQYLRETLLSLKQSTLQPAALYVVNDGSQSTEFLGLVNEYFPNAIVLTHPVNRGLSAARNTGVAACQTPYFLQLDADDLIEPTFMEKAVWALESHPHWAVCNAWHTAFGARQYDWPTGFERGPEFIAANHTIPTAVIRREADRAIGGHDETIRDGCEDWDYWLKMAAHGYWGGTIPEFLIRYRLHDPPTYWPNRDDPDRLTEFQRELRRQYSHLWRGGWPKQKPSPTGPPTDDNPQPFLPNQPLKRSGNHVLLIIPWMTLGGADRFNLLMLEQLTRRGYTFTICTTAEGPSPWLERFLAYSSDCFLLPNFLRLEDYPRFLRHVIASRPIGTVMVSASILGYGLLPYLRSCFPDVAFLDYVHMVDLSWRDGGYARAAVNQRRWLDLTLVSAGQVRGWMVEQGADPERVEVCTINVDTEHWNPEYFDRPALRRDFKVGDEPVILCAARLAPQKRPRLLADVVTRLRKRGCRFTCLIAGDGPEYGWLARYIKWYRLSDQVHLLGMVEPDQMAAVMAASDIFFLPSQEEGIAVTLYEAMAMQLAVVAAEAGGQAELVTPGTGILVPRQAGEAAHYVDALQRLIASPAERRALGQAARARVREYFNIDQMGNRLSELIQHAGEQARTRPQPRVSRAEGWAVAEAVIVNAQQEALAERLFAEHDSDWAFDSKLRAGTVWQRIARMFKKQLLHPLYRWGLSHGLEWLIPVKNWFYHIVKLLSARKA